MSANVLGAVVASYIEDLTAALGEAASGVEGADTSTFRSDVTNEAFNLSVAMIDADGRHTDDELNALIDTFGPRMAESSDLLLATAADLRKTSVVAGRRSWVETDTELFKVLVAADEAQGTDLAEIYYQRTMEVAHVIASLDVVTSAEELEAITELRTRLLAGLRKRRSDGHSLAPRTPPAADAPPPSEDPPERSMEELLAELDDLVGLEAVKDRVHLVADFLRVQQLREDRGLPAVDTSHHLVFTGNPGTGKTTVARLVAQIFRTLGVVERGHLIEVDRAGLVAGYVGQTAPKVTAAFDAADEGMLFIDEAYTLVRGGENDFGREAIDQIVKLIEDRRDRVVLVAAGYPVEMDDFLSANPGLKSRLPTVIEFPDYDTDELVSIVEIMGDKLQYHLSDAARTAVRDLIGSVPRGKGFGNARLARNIFEATINRHASRVITIEDPDESQLSTLDAADIPPDPSMIDEPPRRREHGTPDTPGGAELSPRADSNGGSDPSGASILPTSSDTNGRRGSDPGQTPTENSDGQGTQRSGS
ncbi:MAG: AAA family ATPase [Microthrixaceae bacterium]